MVGISGRWKCPGSKFFGINTDVEGLHAASGKNLVESSLSGLGA